MGQRLTQVLIGITLLVVLFTAYQMQSVMDVSQESHIEATIRIEGNGVDVTVNKLSGETNDEWRAKIDESLAVAGEFEED